MRIYFKTYGCQMNERDSESVAALLVRHGHEVIDQEAGADVVIVNTCSVRGKAEDKALGKLGLMVAGKRKGERALVGAMGCMVQRLGSDLFAKVPGLDFGVGTQRLSRFPAVLARCEAGESPVLEIEGEMGYSNALAGHREGDVSAFVTILLGCDRHCAYCIVPRVRGSEWSRPAADVLDEVRSLSAAGVRDVTLLGQSVMSYGRRQAVWPPEADPSPRGYQEPLSRLLEAVAAIDGIERVRFTSGHPSGCTDELAQAMGDLPEVCEHLHLPMQSASDRVLAAMRRGYTANDYRQAVARLRDRMPGMAITTDIIVGFPGETREDYDQTRRFMDDIGFDNAFIFKYSPRPDTPAADWHDDVPDEEKMRRNQELLADQDRRGLAINEQLVGTIVEVLVEGESLRNAERWAGRSRTNKIVVFEPTPGLQVGDTVKVTIDRVGPQTLYGKVKHH